MLRRQNLRLSKVKVYNTKLLPGEEPVQKDLSYTPSQMLDLTQSGLPVTSSNVSLSSVIDGVPNPGFDIPLDERRGVDIGTLWEQQQSIKKKFRKAHNATEPTKVGKSQVNE